ncbi:Carbon dioxide-concentrating mechanism protein CcmK [Halomicronema hongdechloris C2206]|uniref:Carbon dioxide-concentrating mechanism protein CcmK n=1 Tax=Halomicronema hongdechloris C2206 TaxID=1641165 RepID=A0A1Z3HKU1_9CYAN|nr:Carbon dioxide-concentrating mechanism protein CcmK [Halomicronema hongdechloris C2206]
MQTDLNPAARSRLRTQASQRRSLRGAALGMVSTESFPAIIGTADAMLKAADVFLVGYEKTGSGQCTAIVRGGVANVRMAVEAGIETAQQFSQYVSSSVIPRPQSNLEAVLPICARLDELQQVGRGRLTNQAIGLLETRGFPAMVGAADAMTKSAEITLVAHETIGSGLCTIIIRGSLPNVAIAIDAGMHEAERIGELHAVMVIPRPLDDLEQVLPKVKQMVHDTPLRLPLNLEEKAKELVALEKSQVEVTQAQRPLPETEQRPLNLRPETGPERQPQPLDLPDPEDHF